MNDDLNQILEYLKANLVEAPLCSRGYIQRESAILKRLYKTFRARGAIPHHSTREFQIARHRKQERALDFEYLELCRHKKILFAVDIDIENAHVDAMDWAIPPNLILVSPDSRHCMALWLLDKGYWDDKSQRDGGRLEKTIWTAELIWRALTRSVGGDLSYNRILCKNPFHSKWERHLLHTKRFTFQELIDKLDLATEARAFCNRRKVTQIDSDSNGKDSRSVTLFDRLRYWAYPQRRLHVSEEAFKDALWTEVNRINESFATDPRFASKGPLQKSAVRSRWKQVSGWTWNSYKPRNPDSRRCIMGLTEGDQRERCQKGAEFTASTKKDASYAKLMAIYADLSSKGAKVTQTILATLAGLDRSTVKRYWAEINGVGRYVRRIFAEAAETVKAAVVHVAQKSVDSVKRVFQPKPSTRPRRPVAEIKLTPAEAMAREERLAAFKARLTFLYADSDYASTRDATRRRDHEAADLIRDFERVHDKAEWKRMEQKRKEAEKPRNQENSYTGDSSIR